MNGKRIVLHLLILFIMLGSVYALGLSEDTAEKEVSLSESKQLFLSQTEAGYSAEIRYMAFGPRSGLWKITIKDGTLTAWSINGRVNQQKDYEFANSMRILNLYEKAEMLAENPQKSGTSTVTIGSDGFLSELRYTPDGETGPRDTGYTYTIVKIVSM